MAIVPLLRAGEDTGKLNVEREGPYRRFTLCAPLPEGIWCVWLVGEWGELRLGIPEPENGVSRLCRRLSARSVEGIGAILRGEVRPAGGGEEPWTCVPRPSLLFHGAGLQRELASCGAASVRREEGRLLLALPCDEGAPFPLVSLFCFARICTVCGRRCAVFAFDGGERPLF